MKKVLILFALMIGLITMQTEVFAVDNDVGKNLTVVIQQPTHFTIATIFTVPVTMQSQEMLPLKYPMLAEQLIFRNSSEQFWKTDETIIDTSPYRLDASILQNNNKIAGNYALTRQNNLSQYAKWFGTHWGKS